MTGPSTAVKPAARRASEALPAPMSTKRRGFAEARVKICTTPPIASGPYRLESGPFTTSIRSMSASGMFSMEVVPTVAELTRRPSTSTRVWPALAPRRKRPAGWPAPPVPRNSTKARRWRISASETGPARSMSSRVITSTSRRASAARWGLRMAVTTTASRGWKARVGAGEGGNCWAEAPNAMAAARPARGGVFMVGWLSWSGRASVPAGSWVAFPLSGPLPSGRSPGSPDLTTAFPGPEGPSGWGVVHTGLPLRGQRRHLTGFPDTRLQPR